MGTKIDLKIGDRNGTFEVIECIHHRQRYKYIIKCKCGYQKKIEQHLFAKLKPCKFCALYEFEGSRNGSLLFLKYKGKSLYECKCDCGNTCLLRKRSISCGCHLEKNILKRAEEMIGLKMHSLKIISMEVKSSNKKNRVNQIYFNCLCDCGKKTQIENKFFGVTISCGCFQKQSILRGSQQGNAKYTEVEVASMKEFFLSGTYTQQEICDIFNIKPGCLRRIIANKTWKHVIPKNDKYFDKKIVDKIKNRKTFKRIDHESFIGKIFDGRKVLAIIYEKLNTKYKYQCKCGNISCIGHSAFFKTKACHECSCKVIKDKRKQLIGKKFGSQTVLSVDLESKYIKGLVRCDCGNERTILLHHITSGKHKGSCPKCYADNR